MRCFINGERRDIYFFQSVRVHRGIIRFRMRYEIITARNSIPHAIKSHRESNRMKFYSAPKSGRSQFTSLSKLWEFISFEGPPRKQKSPRSSRSRAFFVAIGEPARAKRKPVTEVCEAGERVGEGDIQRLSAN